MTSKEELRLRLDQLDRDELNIIAKKLRIQGYRRQRKDELLLNILQEAKYEHIEKVLEIRWWDRYHNHVYGAVTIAALLFALINSSLNPFYESPASKEDINEITTAIEQLRAEEKIPTLRLSGQPNIEYPDSIQAKLDKLKRFEEAGIRLTPEAYFEKGLQFLNTGFPEYAIPEFEKAIKLKNDYGNAYYNLAFAWREVGEIEKQLEYSKIAFKLGVAEHDTLLEAAALHSIGSIYHRQNKLEDALAALQKSREKCRLLRYKIGEAWCLSDIGKVYLSEGNFALAIENFENALIIFDEENNKHGKSFTLFTIGLVRYYHREREKAKNYYERALKIADENELFHTEAEILCALGVIYYDQKDMDTALAYYNRALNIAERHGYGSMIATTTNNIGNVYQFLNRHEDALSFYFKSLSSLNPGKSHAYKSESHLSTPIDTRPQGSSDSVNTLASISFSYGKLDDYEKAIRYSKMILEIDSTNANGYYNTACFYSLLDSVDVAIDFLSRGLKYFSMELIQASKTDTDLDNLRSDRRFKNIMYHE